MPVQAIESHPPGALRRSVRTADLSDSARRILGFIEAWTASEGTAVSAALLDPLFATDAPGALVCALAELCSRDYLRRVDGWHYVLR